MDFGGGGQVDHGLGQHQPAFGHADQLHGLRRGDRGLQGRGIGHADVLGGRDDEAPRHEPRVLPRLEHPGEVVQRGVDVGAPDGLDEGAGDVVVLVPGTVVADGGDVERAFGVLQADPDRSGSAPGGLGVVASLFASGDVVRVPEGHAGGGFQRGQRPAGVPAGEPDQVGHGLGAEFDPAVQPADVRRRPAAAGPRCRRR